MNSALTSKVVDGDANITGGQRQADEPPKRRNQLRYDLLDAVPKKLVGGDQPFCLGRESTALQGVAEQ
jgi:hypothetical protein